MTKPAPMDQVKAPPAELGLASQSVWEKSLKTYGPVLVVYLLITWFTRPYTLGDTFDYANAILFYQHGRAPDITNPFWDFGHLFWRPLGWLFFRVSRPLTRWWIGSDEFAQVTLGLMILSWIGGLVAVIFTRALAGLATKSNWIANLVASALVVSNAFLNYAQSGSSYVPGLAFLLVGCYVMARKPDDSDRTISRALVAAVTLALSVCLWFPYAVAIPAALSLPLFLFGFHRSQRKLVIQTTMITGVGIAVAYLTVIVSQGFYSFHSVAHWAMSSAHGYHRSGILRAVFGVARSFISMGNDSMLIKRYLVHDPFSPVSFWDLLRLSIWKVALFYVLLIVLIGNLLFSNRGRRYAGLLLVSAIPMFIFALFVFEGSMLERYLPLYPMVFLSLAYVLDQPRSKLVMTCLSLAFILAMTFANISPTAKTNLRKKEAAAVARIRELRPELDSESLVVVTHVQDELVSFSRDFPFDPINREGNLDVYGVIEIGAQRIDTWRQDFADRALMTWRLKSDVWVSRRLLAPTPKPEWNWVEGDDPRVSWNDLYAFFAQLKQGKGVGGDDGFVSIPPSEENQKFLRSFASKVKSVE